MIIPNSNLSLLLSVNETCYRWDLLSLLIGKKVQWTKDHNIITKERRGITITKVRGNLWPWQRSGREFHNLLMTNTVGKIYMLQHQFDHTRSLVHYCSRITILFSFFIKYKWTKKSYIISTTHKDRIGLDSKHIKTSYGIHTFILN